MADDMKVYKCRKIVKGSGCGEAVVSTDAMCFYLTDPKTGVVIERGHAIQGKSIAGKILVVKSGKGLRLRWVFRFMTVSSLRERPRNPALVRSFLTNLTSVRQTAFCTR